MDITIRSKEQLKSMNPIIVEALQNASKTNKEVPLIYQYLHNPNKPLIVDSENKIGTISNIHKAVDGDYVGVANIKNILALASNFEHVIDNLAVSLHSDTGKFEVDAFIIYDKHAKNDIKVRNEKVEELSKSPKYGEIPIMSQHSPTMMQDIANTLMDEYKKLMQD